MSCIRNAPYHDLAYVTKKLIILLIKLRYFRLASFPDLLTSKHYTRDYFFYPLNTGRSGRFGDVMMMSGGRGLEE